MLKRHLNLPGNTQRLAVYVYVYSIAIPTNEIHLSYFLCSQISSLVQQLPQGIKRDAPSGEDAIAAAVYANQLGEATVGWWLWFPPLGRETLVGICYKLGSPIYSSYEKTRFKPI